MIKQLTVISVFLLAGNAIAANCPDVGNPSLSQAQRDALQTRAEARWQALQNKDIGASYAYATPNYRQVFSQALYQTRFAGGGNRQLQNITVGQPQDDDPTVVPVTVRVLTSSPQTDRTPNNPDWSRITTQITEKWVCTRGEWWYHPQM